MRRAVAAQTRPKSFDHVPVVTLPDDYITELPTFHARMALEHGPVFRRELPPAAHRAFGRWLVYLVGPEANKCALQERRNCFSYEIGVAREFGPLIERGLLHMDEPEHGHDRHIMNPAFTSAYMSRYLPIIQRVVAERTSDWSERGQVDLHREARKITFDVVAETLLGFDTGAEADRLRELFYQLFHTRSDMPAVRHELDTRLLRRIAARRAEPADDLLGMLVSARNMDGEPFTDLQLLGHAHILLAAGHETTTTLAAWTLFLLASHPTYLARVRAELDALPGQADGPLTLNMLRAAHLLSNAISEAARLHSPVGYVTFGVVKDVEVGGYLLPAGTSVMLSLAGCHRLPHLFARPEVFDPDRFAAPREEDKRIPYALVPFGGGPHSCIGSKLAQVEIKALAVHVLRRYELEPVDGQNIIHVYQGSTGFLANGIHVRVQPRSTVEPAPTVVASRVGGDGDAQDGSKPV